MAYSDMFLNASPQSRKCLGDLELTTLRPASGAGQHKPTLLLVDDEPSILSSLKRLLRHEGYDILTAESGMVGLERMASHEVDVVVCDGLMLQMTGAEFLFKVMAMYPDCMRIMLSGFTDPQVVNDAVCNCELFRFVAKPWDDRELLDTIRDAFRARASAHRRVAGVESTSHA
jgi:response regulator RpfG family c-di-GMP phosphodiesterase